MDDVGLSGVLLTPLKRIPGQEGEVRHGVKATDPGFSTFGEAYFSSVNRGAVKGWKRHSQMTLNLIAVSGCIRFIVRDDQGDFAAFELSPDLPDGYARLTVPPGLWMAFGGKGEGVNLLLNVANLPHDPSEAENRPLANFEWSW